MIPGNANSLLLASAAAAAAAPGVRSLRFNDDDSAYLNRTPSSASNRKTWSWSAWVKRSTLGTNQKLFSAGTSSNYFALAFNTSDQIQVDSFGTGANAFYMHTGDMVFRDASAWYSVVAILDTTESTGSDRFKLYINGSQVTLTVGTNVPPSNADQLVNSTIEHKIGNISYGSTSQYFDGYLTDVYFIDGLALTASSFGSTDSNGVWQRSTYSGTFGTNGFHVLDFENEATIGDDSSGNSNDFTANNLSDTAGAGNDVLLDFPVNGSESDTGAGGEVSGNYATLNPLSKGSNVTLSNGNLVYAGSAASGHANKYAFSTIAVSSGKWYVEATCEAKGDNFYVGVMGNVSANYTPSSSTSLGFQATGWGYWTDGDIYNNGSVIDSAPASVGVGDVIGVALDVDNRTVTFYKNGTQQGSTATSLTADATWMFSSQSFKDATVAWNFGQRAFAYSAPSGYKGGLCTTNLPTPTIADGSDYFDVKTYDGNGGTQTISGLGFSPDVVWVKRRDSAIEHILFDSVRGFGANKELTPNANYIEGGTGVGQPNTDVWGYVDSVTSDGFVVEKGSHSTGASANTTGGTYVGWVWDAGSSTASNTDGDITTSVRVNQTAGFSIATYSYNNSDGNVTLGHGLGAIPDLVIRKDRNLGEDWSVYSKAIGFTQRAHLNTTAAWSGTSTFGSASATSTVNRANNMNTGTYVDYSFVSIPGFSAIGTYQGNGSSTDGPFAFVDFRIAWLLIKDATSTGAWLIWDVARQAYNAQGPYLLADTSDAEQDSDLVDFLSNGFKIRTTAGSMNSSGQTYLFLAFAENPFQANGGLAR